MDAPLLEYKEEIEVQRKIQLDRIRENWLTLGT